MSDCVSGSEDTTRECAGKLLFSCMYVCIYKCRTCVQGYDITGVFMRNWDNPDEAGDDHQCPIDQVSE